MPKLDIRRIIRSALIKTKSITSDIKDFYSKNFLVVGFFVLVFISAAMYIPVRRHIVQHSLSSDSSFWEQGNENSPVTIVLAVITEKQSDPTYLEQSFRVSSIFLDPELMTIPEDSQNICISLVQLLLNNGSQNDYLNLLNGAICRPVDYTGWFFDTASSPTSDIAMTLNQTGWFLTDSTYYPYDGFDFMAAALVTVTFTDNNNKEVGTTPVMPEMWISTLNSGGWGVTSPESSVLFDFWFPWEVTGGYSFEKRAEVSGYPVFPKEYSPLIARDAYSPRLLRFTRPLALQISFPISALAMLGLVMLLASIDDQGVFAQGALAFIFGIYGYREIFTPNIFHPNFPPVTLVDSFVFILFVIYSNIIIGKLILFNRANRAVKKKMRTRQF